MKGGPVKAGKRRKGKRKREKARGKGDRKGGKWMARREWRKGSGGVRMARVNGEEKSWGDRRGGKGEQRGERERRQGEWVREAGKRVQSRRRKEKPGRG